MSDEDLTPDDYENDLTPDDYENEWDSYDDEFDYDSQDCHMDENGNCGKAGSEECDWHCPLSRFIRN